MITRISDNFTFCNTACNLAASHPHSGGFVKKLLFLISICCLAAGNANAQMKPEDAIHLRQSHLTVLGYNFGSIGAMVNDKKPFNKEELITNATIVELMSKPLANFFGAGSDKGAPTKANGKIWTEMDKFKGNLEKMQVEATKLAAVSKTGDLAAIKTQFGATGQTCKACHDAYRDK